MNKFIFFISGLLFLMSCETLNTKIADDDVPVIESYIHPENSVTMTISKQLLFNSGDTNQQFLEGLDVWLWDANESYLLEDNGSGVYSNHEIEIVEDKSYTLEFEYNDLLVSAETLIPQKPAGFAASETTIEAFSPGNFDPSSGEMPEMPDPVTLSWDNPDGLYHMVVVSCIEDDPTLINDDDDDDRPERAFRNAPTQASEQELQAMTFSYYGTHYIILYRLNTEYATLYEQLGSSSLDITTPPSNVSNGLGIFTGINSDTLIVEVVSK